MPLKTSLRFLTLLSLAIACLSNAKAEVISLNFIRGSDGMSPLATTDIAGAEPVSNWNNSTIDNANGEATGIVLTDSGGAVTTATATWLSGSASWSVPTAGAGSPGDMLMMTGYLDQGGDGLNQIHNITVENVPYPSYDVYLYHSSNGGANRTARYQANGVDIYTRNLAPANTFNGFINAGYATLAEAADAANPAGNWARWDGLSGSTLIIEGQGYGNDDGGLGGNTRRAPIQGIQIVEATPGLPNVENLAASDIAVTSATANADLVSNGLDDDEATLTIYWGLSDGAADPDAWENSSPAGTLSAPGSFSAQLSGLVGNTTYYYRAFASNSVGGDWVTFAASFLTLPIPTFPEVENLPASLIGISSATLNGELLNNGAGADQSDMTIYWGLTDGGTDTATWENSVAAGSLSAPGNFSAALTGLTENTFYYYRAFATNSAGDDWATDTATFATQRPQVAAISLNFIRASSGATPLLVTDIAGVVPASNWNNSTTVNANAELTGIALTDDGGAPSGATATWQTGGASWSVATAGAGSAADMKMMTGYLDQGGDGNGQIHTVSVTDIPYGTYDVYLYHSSSGGRIAPPASMRMAPTCSPAISTPPTPSMASSTHSTRPSLKLPLQAATQQGTTSCGKA